MTLKETWRWWYLFWRNFFLLFVLFPRRFYQCGMLLHLFTLFCWKLISLAPSRCKWGIKDKCLGGNYLCWEILCPREQLIIRLRAAGRTRENACNRSGNQLSNRMVNSVCVCVCPFTMIRICLQWPEQMRQREAASEARRWRGLLSLGVGGGPEAEGNELCAWQMIRQVWGANGEEGGGWGWDLRPISRPLCFGRAASVSLGMSREDPSILLRRKHELQMRFFTSPVAFKYTLFICVCVCVCVNSLTYSHKNTCVHLCQSDTSFWKPACSPSRAKKTKKKNLPLCTDQSCASGVNHAQSRVCRQCTCVHMRICIRGVFDLVWNVCVCVCALGEGLTIVCACFTEPLWQRKRGSQPTHSREREREEGSVSSCECMNSGMINPLEKDEWLEGEAQKWSHCKMGIKDQEALLSSCFRSCGYTH